MITLARDCLVFQLASGENVPFSPEMLSFDFMGGSEEYFDPDFVHDAANAVFHYFREELGRQTVTVGEFAGALEKVLRGFSSGGSEPSHSSGCEVIESDLSRLARESGEGCELLFFPRLRDELRERMRQRPKVLRFRGLRGCVKALTGARRWNWHCRSLQEQIVDYLRKCVSSEVRQDISLVIE